MSKQTVSVPATVVEDMIGGRGRVRRPCPESETQVRPNRSGNIVDVSTDIHDTLAPAGDVDEQIALNEASLREIIGTPIETDDVSVHTSHNAPDPGSEAPSHAIISNVKSGAAEPNKTAPSEGNDQRGTRPSIDRSGKAGVGTASTVPPARTTLTEGGEPSVQTEHTAPATPAISTVPTEPSETTVPTPQTETTEPSADSGDALNSTDTAPTVPTLDADSTRRSVKQRKSDLDEYRQRYMKIPRIADRKPVFVSHTTRDRLDRIVRLLGERGMSVSGLIENIALHHLATHEPDVEHWRKM